MKNTAQLSIRDADGGAVLTVKVVPGSSRDEIVGVLGEALKIATASPAERGKLSEKKDPYYSRDSKRSRNVTECIIKPIDSHLGNGKIVASTRECSKGGFSARYKGTELPSGIKCLVSISALGKNNKKGG